MILDEHGDTIEVDALIEGPDWHGIVIEVDGGTLVVEEIDNSIRRHTAIYSGNGLWWAQGVAVVDA